MEKGGGGRVGEGGVPCKATTTTMQLTHTRRDPLPAELHIPSTITSRQTGAILAPRRGAGGGGGI